MATISYTPKGVCSRKIDIEVEDGIVKKVHFTGGCNGNTQGVSKLVEGMKVQDVIDRLEGIDCNGRGTSCPAQLAEALKSALKSALVTALPPLSTSSTVRVYVISLSLCFIIVCG